MLYYYRRRLASWFVRRVASPERQIAHSLRAIRGHLAALGFPVDHLTDEELIAGCARAGETLRWCGVSLDDAGRALARFGDALRECEGGA